MRMKGSHRVYRVGGLAVGDCGCESGALGALPENFQNPLYPVGTLNSNYEQAINNPMWDAMKEIAKVPYPATLPYAGAGMQNPWGTLGRNDFTVDGRTLAAATSPPAIIPTGGGGGGPKSGRAQLFGLGDAPALTSPFPWRIKEPFITGNNFWYTGQPTLNKGEPSFYNDAEEFLRSAVVDSDWDRLEAWLSWAFQNGMTGDKLTQLDFGRFKWTGTKLNKKMYPFSAADYKSFYERFLKYTATTAPADNKCIKVRYEMAMKAVASSPRNQFVLRLGDCPLQLGWEQGLIRVVAAIAIPVALVVTAGAIAGALTAGAAAGGAGAAAGVGATTGAAAGAGAGAAAGAAAAIPAGIEVVTVAATALPVIGAGTVAVTAGAALASGALITASAPPPLTAQPPTPNLPPEPVIETVTVTGNVPVVTAPEVATIGAGLSTGAIVATSTPPAPVQPTEPPPQSDVIEEVVTEAPRIAPIDPALAPIIGAPGIALDLPNISVPEPTPPHYEDDPTLTDRIKSGLQDAASQYGEQYVQDYLADQLTDQLGRPPTNDDLDAWQDWIDAGGLQGGSSAGNLWPWLIVGGLAAAVVWNETKRGKKSRRRVRT